MKYLVIMFFAVLVTENCQANGLDCLKADSQIEKTICSTPELEWDDRELNAVFRLAIVLDPKTKKTLRSEQSQWLKQRDRCGDELCIHRAYLARTAHLKQLVNASADQFPDRSEWSRSFAVNESSECLDSFSVHLIREGQSRMIGKWDASAFCHAFLNYGVLDIREDGRILDIRILGGRGPSHHVGVALLARKGDRLYIASMYDRSSIGMQGDYEYFDDVPLTGAAVVVPISNASPAENERCPEPDVEYFIHGRDVTECDLNNAWIETEKAAISEGGCQNDRNINVCMRKTRP